MCDIKKAFRRAVGVKDPDFVDYGSAVALPTAKQSAATALLAQQQAQDQIKAAADSASEQTRLANEARLRKLMRAGPFGAALPSGFGAAPVATRELYGVG